MSQLHVLLLLAGAGFGSQALAQSVYVDVGPLASPFGVPPATYGALLPPGTWNAVASTPAPNLLGVDGLPSGVSLTTSAPPASDACAPAAIPGGDGALFGDRWTFDPVQIDLTLTGLAPGTYLVSVHVLIGTCLGMFSPLSVAIAGANPPASTAMGVPWVGAAALGTTTTLQFKTLASGENLVLTISAPMGFTSYTQICGLQVLRLDAPVAYCAGDGTGAACPCGNSGALGHGCANSSFASGARLDSAGVASLSADTVLLTATGIPGPVLFVQNAGPSSPAVAFGDGLLCASGNLVRLGVVFAVAGSATYPGGSTPAPVHVAGAPLSAGDTRGYQCWYRDAVAFCASETFNLTNGQRWTWRP